MMNYHAYHGVDVVYPGQGHVISKENHIRLERTTTGLTCWHHELYIKELAEKTHGHTSFTLR